jgi:hypothetical protein
LREASEISREGPLGSSFVRGDATLRLSDLALEIGQGLLLRVACCSRHIANPEAGDFQSLQSLAVLLELNPVPGDVAIAFSDHVCSRDRMSGQERALARTSQVVDRTALLEFKDGTAWLTES